MSAFAVASTAGLPRVERAHTVNRSTRRPAVGRSRVRAALENAEEGVAGAKVPTQADAELIKATLDGDVRTVEKLLSESGAVPTAVDENGRSPLHFAAGMGIPSTCELLVKCGAELNLPDVTGYTPLHMAAGYLRPGTVQALVDLGADPNIRAPSGQTALELAQQLLKQEPEKKFFRANARHTKLKEVVEVLTPVTSLDSTNDSADTSLGAQEKAQAAGEQPADDVPANSEKDTSKSP